MSMARLGLEVSIFFIDKLPAYLTQSTAWPWIIQYIYAAAEWETPACYRSLLERGLSTLVLTTLAYTCSGQSKRRVPLEPMRTPEWSSRLSIPYTQPRGTPEHERHVIISFTMDRDCSLIVLIGTDTLHIQGNGEDFVVFPRCFYTDGSCVHAHRDVHGQATPQF